MASTQQAGFIHSVPVPIIYKTAAKIAKKVKEGQDSLKNLIYACRGREVKAVYALVVETFKRSEILDDLIQKSQLLIKEPRLDVWLAKVMIWDLLWGKKRLKRGSKPVETILKYENDLKDLLESCEDSAQPVLKHDVSKPRYVRVNTLKITTEEAINNFVDEGWSLVPLSKTCSYKDFQECLDNLKPDEFVNDIHIPDLLIFPPKTEFHHHEAYKAGCIILQDKASCLPVHLLAPPRGSVVLDTCAAPGMKTTQLAALLQNEGTVYAVEVSAKRGPILQQMVESAGASCVKTILKDVMEVTDEICPDVEYILVDPSCTGSGITDRIEIEKLDINKKMERLKKLCNFQAKLLRHTMKSFPKAKRIVYSTCSINSEENEDVVRQTLETSREFKLVNAKEILTTWNNTTSDFYPELGDMCIFANPTEDKTNGFFVAVFERMEKGEQNPYLNYELCKLYDKHWKKYGPEDDTEIHTKSKNDIKSEDLPETGSIIVNPVNEHEGICEPPIKKMRIKNEGIKDEKSYEIFTTPNNSGESLENQNTPKREKRKKNKLDTNENVKTEEDELKLEKKNKKKKSVLENENSDSNQILLENTTVTEDSCDQKIKKKNKKSKHVKDEDIKINLNNTEESEFTTKKKKDKSKSKNLDAENEKPDETLVSEKTVKEKKKRKKTDTLEENGETQSFSSNSIECSQELKMEKVNDLDAHDENVNSSLDNSIPVQNKSKEKRKKKDKNDKIIVEENFKNHCSENSIELNNTLKSEKKTKKNKTNTLEHIESTTASSENISKKKKEKKDKNVHIEEDNSSNVITEEIGELEQSLIKTKKEKKHNKLDKTEEAYDEAIEKKIKKKSVEQDLDNGKNCQTEINPETDCKKKEKSKKNKRTNDETLEQSFCDTNGTEPAAKRAKKNKS